MIGEEQCRKILQQIIDQSGVDHAEAYLSSQDLALTRFANNEIHQNVVHGDAQLNIRAVIGRRQGRATTNDLSEAGIAKAGEEARSNALLMPEDPDFLGLPDPETSAVVAAYDEDTADCSPEERAQVVGMICRRAEDQGLNAAGFYRTGAKEQAVMNTRGTWAYHRGSFAGLLITARSEPSAAWSKGTAWRMKNIEVDTLINEAIEKALRGRNPQPIEPGKYAVILSHYAADDILGALSSYGMSAQLVQDGRSWMMGLMGKSAMSPLISIWDDGCDPKGWPAPFDAEGVPRQRVDIVTDGIVGAPVYNSYTAGKEGKLSTGHQGSPTGGPSASNLFMKPGNQSVDQMIESTERGLYVTRFFYTRLVHSSGCVMTGMTRDGTFLIENGRLGHPVKDLRFTQSYVEALNGVEAVGKETTLLMNEGPFPTNVPALKISSFNFTGVTV
jgi:PmbA protein